MSRPRSRPLESRRAWLSGLAVIITTIVSYMAFWRLAPGITFIVGCVALVTMLVAAWIAGGERAPNQSAEKSPPRQSDLGA